MKFTKPILFALVASTASGISFAQAPTAPTAAPVPAVPPPAIGEGAYRVTLESFGESKIQTIKIVREVTGLGLAETKKLVESAPVVIRETDEARAKALVKSLEAIGAKAKAELLKK